ncbi:hypothetical protein GCM10009682_04000 [Luedemannella flava]|uniref:4Fe-4S Wbl-type domain-containing protein n=1 Tax=Luedemannella flava TaxID=349316 RepID=A0ABP4XMM2_9ACTN
MIHVSFDPQDPPDDPPPGADPSYWRVAVRLFRDHSPPSDAGPGPTPCRQCNQPWPCAARRAAERGLIGALRVGRRNARRPNRGRWGDGAGGAARRGTGWDDPR